jgi:hypothetical protein
MRHLVVVSLVVACSGQKSSEAPPAAGSGSASGSGSAAQVRATPECIDDATKLRAWLRELVAQNVQSFDTVGVKLVKLDEAAKPIAPAPAVVITAKDVAFEGKLLAALPIKDKGKALREALAAVPKGPDTLFLVDAAAPWSAVSAVATAAVGADRGHVTFVFAGNGPNKPAPPPPSPIDKELDDLAKPADPANKAAKLADPKDPSLRSIPDKVFKDCPVKDLFTQIGNAATAEDKGKLVSEGVANAVADCACKVDVPSVQRLMWSWYGRDRVTPVLGMTVDFAKTGGTPVTAKLAAPWSETAQVVLAAAKQGKPLVVK